MKHRIFGAMLIALVGGSMTLPARADVPVDIDIAVGHTAAGGLAALYDFGTPTPLDPVSGLFNGWAGDEPGFDHVEADAPGDDLYTLEPGADIVFEIVSIDDALIGNPLTDALDQTGEQLVLGDETLHRHIEWLINADDPTFDPLQSVWDISFKLIDTGSTSYADSPVYTWTMTPAPEPATATLLLAGCVALIRRRRGR